MSQRLMRANRPWLLEQLDAAADDDDDGVPYAAGHPHVVLEEWVEEINEFFQGFIVCDVCPPYPPDTRPEVCCVPGHARAVAQRLVHAP